MRRLFLALLLCSAAACSSTPAGAPDGAGAVPLEPGSDAAILQGPDGWQYAGVTLEGDERQFILSKGDEHFAISADDYSRFVPTLFGNVFAVDQLGVWWRFERGERTTSMPWTGLLPTGEISGEGDELTGAWPVRMINGGCAKIDEKGAVIELYPQLASLELVGSSWVLESQDGSIEIDAPGGDPMTGGKRYSTPDGNFVVYFAEERTMFDPHGLELKRMASVPAVRVLAAPEEDLLLGLVPSFEDDDTVALYDYYADEMREKRLRSAEVVRVVEPDYSPHMGDGTEASTWDLVLTYSAEGGHWSAYALETDDEGARLELVLRGHGDEQRAVQLLEAELVSRLSHELAP